MIPRRTLAGEAAVSGLGLFTGAASTLTILPAPAGAGLAFDAGGVMIPVVHGSLDAEPVVAAFGSMPPRHTVLSSGGARAVTTEHALAALVGLGVTDAVLSLSGGEELPIGDGSALAFVEAIESAGLTRLDAVAEPLVVRDTVVIEDGRGGTIVAEPAAAPDYLYRLDYGDGSVLGSQSARWGGDAASFAASIAPARTFSMREEAESMRRLGLFAAFTPEDLPVVDDDGSLIGNAWRFADEAARHKLLDLIGDLSLVGRPILGRVSASKTGHASNHAMARALDERFG
ncbi:MAG: UDP-3-O-acyl-N-acetylglucosamine deacetylase [Planctomycetota bacterium]